MRYKVASLTTLALAGCAGHGIGAVPSTTSPNTFVRGAAIVNWPQFRFNDDRIGVNPHETTLTVHNVPRLQPAWQAQLGALVDYSSPAVVNGVAYIGSSDGRLWAFSANGCGQSVCTQPLWSSVSLAQIIDSPTVANGLVYVGSQTSPSSNDGKLDVFSAGGCGQQSCPPLWQGLIGTDAVLMSSPAVSRGHVFIGAHDGKLYAFKANGCGQSTCMPIWTATTGGSIESSPTVHGNTVYVGSDDGDLYAFAARGCGSSTCRPIWTGRLDDAAFDSSPAVAGSRVYIGSQHGVAAFNAAGCGHANCQPLWRGTNGSDFFAGSPAVFKNRVYIGDESGLAVFKASGCGQTACRPLWLDFGSGAQAAVASSPTVANGVVYAGRNTGEVLAWKAGPCGKFLCNEIWKGPTNDEIVNSSPAVVNGQVYIGSADKSTPSNISGRLYVFALPRK